MTRKEFEQRIEQKRQERNNNKLESFNCLWQNKHDRFDMYDICVELYNYRSNFAQGEVNYTRLTNMIEQIENTLVFSSIQ